MKRIIVVKAVVLEYQLVGLFTADSPHRLLPIDELASALKIKTGKLNATLLEREGELSNLFKLVSRQASEFETGTGEMIQQLRGAQNRNASF